MYKWDAQVPQLTIQDIFVIILYLQYIHLPMNPPIVHILRSQVHKQLSCESPHHVTEPLSSHSQFTGSETVLLWCPSAWLSIGITLVIKLSACTSVPFRQSVMHMQGMASHRNPMQRKWRIKYFIRILSGDFPSARADHRRTSALSIIQTRRTIWAISNINIYVFPYSCSSAIHTIIGPALGGFGMNHSDNPHHLEVCRR